MVKKKTAAIFTAAMMASAIIPMSVSASPEISNPGCEDITSVINPQVIGTYCISGDTSLMFDGDQNTSFTINRSGSTPYIGGFVLDAGEGKTFAQVNSIDFTCVNATDLYIFGSNDNIADAIQANSDKDLCGSKNNYANFNSTNLGIDINLISNAEAAYYKDNDGIFWGTNVTNDMNYRYLYIGTPKWNSNAVIKEMKLMHAGEGSVKVNTENNCKVTYNSFKAGEDVTITVTADEGYEVSKLNINGATVSPVVEGNTATYTVSKASAIVTVDAWADPIDKLEMKSIEAKPEELTTVTRYNTIPEAWSDNNATTFADFGVYPTTTIFDAGEGKKYVLDKIITYARASHPGRSHFKLYGTNDPLTADMFNSDGVVVENKTEGSKFTTLTQDNNAYFGTGSWGNNGSGGVDAVRGEYMIDGDAGYRYIVLQSDHKYMMSLSELKFYGSIETEETHDSNYFKFSASANEINSFNKIAIKLNDDTSMSSDFNATAEFSGNTEVQYAVNITDLPEGIEVEKVKLYTEAE
ncbi:MAG: hypothetical protein Q4G33_11340 [bacterium]|nr:hypothetical protein [bacterium]